MERHEQFPNDDIPEDDLEESESESEEEVKRPQARRPPEPTYTSTNLITKNNTPISEITLTRFKKDDIQEEIETIINNQSQFTNTFGFVDPRKILKDAKDTGTVESLI